MEKYIFGSKGKEHYNWKAEKVGYSGIHKWIVRNYGRAIFCSNNTEHQAKRYDWANISGEYKRDINDWKQLCRSCHSKFDMTLKQREHMKKLGVRIRKPIIQSDLNGGFIKKYISISQAGKSLGIDISFLCKVLKGKRPSAKGYLWRYA